MDAGEHAEHKEQACPKENQEASGQDFLMPRAAVQQQRGDDRPL